MIKRVDEKYCHECGEIIRSKAEICPFCGVRQPLQDGVGTWPADKNHSLIGQGLPRKKQTATLLAFFFGGIGIGQPLQGSLYVIFCWTLVPALIGLVESLNYLVMNEKTFQKRYSGPAFSAT